MRNVIDCYCYWWMEVIVVDFDMYWYLFYVVIENWQYDMNIGFIVCSVNVFFVDIVYIIG